MAKHRRIEANGRSKAGGKHVRHYAYELSSPAYRALTCVSRALYTEIKSFHNGSNNGEVFMSVRKAADLLCVSPNTAVKGLRQLCENGFIKPLVAGSFNWKMRHATTWVLTEYPLHGNAPTRDYQRWGGARKNQKPVSNFEPSVSKIDTDR